MSKPTIGHIHQYAERKKSSFKRGIFYKPKYVVTKVYYIETLIGSHIWPFSII